MQSEQESVSNDNEKRLWKKRTSSFLHRLLILLVLSAVFSQLAYCSVEPWLGRIN